MDIFAEQQVDFKATYVSDTATYILIDKSATRKST